MIGLLLRAQLMARTAAGYVSARIGNERGQDLIEYALLGGLMAAGIAILGGILLGVAGVGAFSDMGDAITACIDFDDTTACG